MRRRTFLVRALEDFKMAAGNFYINDKSTGSVVGQQPFGGGRMSGLKCLIIWYIFDISWWFYAGTNDKAGGPHYVLRWTTPQSIKERFTPLRDIGYSYMNN